MLYISCSQNGDLHGFTIVYPDTLQQNGDEWLVLRLSLHLAGKSLSSMGIHGQILEQAMMTPGGRNGGMSPLSLDMFGHKPRPASSDRPTRIRVSYGICCTGGTAQLVGGLEHFLFFHILERIVPTD